VKHSSSIPPEANSTISATVRVSGGEYCGNCHQ